MDRHQDSANKVPGIALIVSLAPVLLQTTSGQSSDSEFSEWIPNFIINGVLSSSLALIFSSLRVISGSSI